ncbi:hypothetical protein [Candidatus Mycalebacterium sp.]
MKFLKRILEREIDADEINAIKEADKAYSQTWLKSAGEAYKDGGVPNLKKTTLNSWRAKAEVYNRWGHKNFATVYDTAATEYENYLEAENSAESVATQMTAMSKGYEKVGDKNSATMYKVVAYACEKVGDEIFTTMADGFTWDFYRKMADKVGEMGDGESAEVLRAYATALENHKLP